MVDGLHRAATLSIACDEKIKITEINTAESKDKRIDVLFPCDMHQLPA